MSLEVQLGRIAFPAPVVHATKLSEFILGLFCHFIEEKNEIRIFWKNFKIFLIFNDFFFD